MTKPIRVLAGRRPRLVPRGHPLPDASLGRNRDRRRGEQRPRGHRATARNTAPTWPSWTSSCRSSNGLDATARLAATSPRHADHHPLHERQRGIRPASSARGAVGYLLKNISPRELEQAIRAVAQGETYLSPAISKHVIAAYLERVGGEAIGPFERLTPRQREVLQLVAEGHTTKDIAREAEAEVEDGRRCIAVS